MRVLVTGSRNWPDEAVVHEILDQAAELLREQPELFDLYEVGRDVITVVHGDCPTGADHFAASWQCKDAGISVVFEPHPADWEKHGKAAGPIRNSEMVAAGADLMVAFFQPGSRGTMDCYCKGKLAGIYSWETGTLDPVSAEAAR